MLYGYARVSTRDQNADRQLISIREFADKEYPGEEIRIYVDKQSGKDFNRSEYKSLMRRIKRGDVLLVSSIDRLGRNYDDMTEEWRKITRVKGIFIVVLDMSLLDTRRNGDITYEFMAELSLQFLSYFAHIEREKIRERQAEGIAAAHARGVRFGKPPRRRPDDFEAVRAQWMAGEISARQAGRLLGCSHSTFLTWVNDAE